LSTSEQVMELTPEGAQRTLVSNPQGRDSYAWWGMVWLILTEATLFAALIATYFYLRFQYGPTWPPPGIEPPHLELPLVMTLILLASSAPVHWADKAISRGRQGGLRAGLALGFLLGAAFLALTWGVEWPEALHEFTPRGNVYGSLYFTITGFHGLHLVVGLIFSLWVQLRAWAGAFDQRRHIPVVVFSMYWHFVDVVWIFVLSTVYLSPHL
jgi:heme/copper-type cytochrome/quinol oxidase subunit 3